MCTHTRATTDVIPPATAPHLAEAGVREATDRLVDKSMAENQPMHPHEVALREILTIDRNSVAGIIYAHDIARRALEGGE